MNLVEQRVCLACENPLRGRADKKFCNDYCRNYYNNHQKSINKQDILVKTINAALLKNRQLLSSLLTGDKETSKATRGKLLGLGYQFNFMTHTYTTRSGSIYYYCYDYGYLPLEKDWFLIVKNKPGTTRRTDEQMNKE